MRGAVKHVAMQVALYCLGILTGLGMSVESRKKRPSASQGDGTRKRDGEYKMVLVVNSSLKMGKGKIGMDARSVHEVLDNVQACVLSMLCRCSMCPWCLWRSRNMFPDCSPGLETARTKESMSPGTTEWHRGPLQDCLGLRIELLPSDRCRSYSNCRWFKDSRGDRSR